MLLSASSSSAFEVRVVSRKEDQKKSTLKHLVLDLNRNTLSETMKELLAEYSLVLHLQDEGQKTPAKTITKKYDIDDPNAVLLRLYLLCRA
jgi:hypothetical protein